MGVVTALWLRDGGDVDGERRGMDATAPAMATVFFMAVNFIVLVSFLIEERLDLVFQVLYRFKYYHST